AEDKAWIQRRFVSPASGIIKEIVRGLKRRLLRLIIEVDQTGKQEELEITGEWMERLEKGGIFGQIRARPFNCLASPGKIAKKIFVKAIESAPFSPPPHLELQGFEKEFQFGLSSLSKFAPVHLVCDSFFPRFQNVEMHSAKGPHPIGNFSTHISAVDPIFKEDDLLWTLTVHDVICIGKLLMTGKVHTTRVISIAGEGICEDKRGYYRVNKGISVESLVKSKLCTGDIRLISGDPLMGDQVDSSGYLGCYHNVFCAILERPPKRKFLHFFRFGNKKFTATKTYVISKNQEYSFDTNQHGETRAFVDGSIYDKIMPLPIFVEPLIKAIMAEDFDKAKRLGFLEIAEEDFALSAFICPSKIDMVGIVKRGLDIYASQYLD
ncbi:MAG: NADH:ubiquinone reductase (Na(+)-transporting) subunit A, partial [Simkaniaceae bacterium]|nr:NADH:ubiquinone reductase (Na(+)-transporting) subunit A [Simkaniaceae bacterium]